LSIVFFQLISVPDINMFMQCCLPVCAFHVRFHQISWQKGHLSSDAYACIWQTVFLRFSSSL